MKVEISENVKMSTRSSNDQLFMYQSSFWKMPRSRERWVDWNPLDILSLQIDKTANNVINIKEIYGLKTTMAHHVYNKVRIMFVKLVIPNSVHEVEPPIVWAPIGPPLSL